jgi:hypothetical protein
MSVVHVSNSASILGASSYDINLTGGASGTFTISNGSVGQGTYIYQPTGNQARLRLDYTGDFAGDFDDMTLFFNSSSSGTHSGTQKVGDQTGPITGSFTY